MSAHDFFIALISLCGKYINAFVDLICASPFVVPFCVLFGCGCVLLVHKFLRG